MYRRTFQNVETGCLDATGLLNKADGKNRESENPEEISLLKRPQPPRLCSDTGGALRSRESAERGEDGTSVCEYDRNDKTPKGYPTGSCVNGRPPKLADGNMAPHTASFPRTIHLFARESNMLVFERSISNNYARTVEAETMSRRQDRFPLAPVISSRFFHIGTVAPQLYPFLRSSPSRQREKPLVFEKVVEHGRLDGWRELASRLFVTGFRSA